MKLLTATQKNIAFITASIVLILAQNCCADQNWSTFYNAQNLLESEDGPRIDVQDINTYTYNANGTRATTTNALGQITTFNSYDSRGRVTSFTDPNGITTTIQYTPRGSIEFMTVKHPGNQTALDAVTHSEYDETEKLKALTQPNGLVLHYEYSDAGTLKAVYNDLGERIDYTLDAAGNRKNESIKSTTGEIKFSVTRAFDELSRVIDITGNHGQNTHHTYDANGNIDKTTDAKSHQFQHRYDPFNRLKKLIDPKLKETQYTYTNSGQIDTVTDARGHVTDYDYDAFGNLTKLTSPDTGITQFHYDEAGNRTYQLDARGVETIYRYDALNRPISIEYPSNSIENVTLSYDSTANGNYGKGHLTGITDLSGSTTYTYNYLGQITQKNYVVRGKSYSIGYAYDLSGIPTQITYPSGRIVTFQYNSLKQLTGITTQSNTTASPQTLMSNGQYLPFGPLRQWTHGNGITETHNFDSDYRALDITAQGPFAVLDQVFGYDLANNIETIQNPFSSAQNQSFGYDELDRLKTATGNYGSINFQYDDVGNRLQKLLTIGANTTNEIYQIAPSNNRLNNVNVTVNGAAGPSRSFTYDNAGNLQTGTLNGQSSVLDTNEANRQELVFTNGKQINLYYNYLGQRVSKTVTESGASRSEHYHYDELGNLIAVTDGTGEVMSETVFAGSQPLAVNLLTDSPLKASLSISQKVPNPGDVLILSSLVEGGNGKPLEYRFRVKDTNNVWTLVSDWSSTAGYSWTTPTTLGNYTWELSVRNFGSTTSTTTTANVGVVAPLAQTTQLSSNKVAPGAGFTLTTTSTGGITSTAYQKRIRLKGPSTNNTYVTLRDWNESNSYTANIPTQLGAYTLEVAVLQYPENTSLAITLLPITVTNTPVVTPSQASASINQVGAAVLLSSNQGTGTFTRQFLGIHTDHLKTPRALTNGIGKVIWSWQSQPFGETAANDDPDGDGSKVIFNMRFPGQYVDKETGLHYNYFRDYDPLSGRYIESDPIGLDGGINTYGYVTGNPLSLTDRLGLSPACGRMDTTVSCACKTPTRVAQANCQAAGGIPLFPGVLNCEVKEGKDDDVDCFAVLIDCQQEVQKQEGWFNSDGNTDKKIKECIQRKHPECISELGIK